MGILVGFLVGKVVGELVGYAVGLLLGTLVGVFVGIFVGDLHKKGFDVETCSKFQMGPNLINDGAGGGKKETNPLHPNSSR